MKYLVALAVIFALGGCGIPQQISAKEKQGLAERIEYIKDARGICYAAIGSVSYGDHVVYSITSVDCKKVGLQGK